MFAEQKIPTYLEYDKIPRVISHPQGKFRQKLRSINIEALIRRLWTTYHSLSSWIEPISPAEPIYWMDKIAAILPASPKKVLDLGGGGGQYKQYLSTEGDLYVILEVDYDSYLVQKNIGRHNYVIGDGHSNLFCEESFNVISLFEVLEHVRNPFQIFANCARWLKPGGLVVLSAPQYWHCHGWPHDYYRYTIYGLKELANNAGLQVIDYWAMGALVSLFSVL